MKHGDATTELVRETGHIGAVEDAIYSGKAGIQLILGIVTSSPREEQDEK